MTFIEIKLLSNSFDNSRDKKLFTNAIVHPGTVMVEFGHAPVTFAAVLGAQRSPDNACGAELFQRELVLLDEFYNRL